FTMEKAETIEEMDDIMAELEEEGYVKHKSGRGKQRQTRSVPRRFVSSTGIDIWVGRNNKQNDQLTLKRAGKNDLWLHVQGFPGTHVIMDLPAHISSINEVPDSALEEAAILAAHFSKAREAEKVPVDYTFRANVKKPKGAHPGMVIYDNYWTININPQDPRVQDILATVES
ncbi:MAG: NFACT RNA binding domain-containing protein, partial [Acidobacteriota bacterium]